MKGSILKEADSLQDLKGENGTVRVALQKAMLFWRSVYRLEISVD